MKGRQLLHLKNFQKEKKFGPILRQKSCRQRSELHFLFRQLSKVARFFFLLQMVFETKTKKWQNQQKVLQKIVLVRETKQNFHWIKA